MSDPSNSIVQSNHRACLPSFKRQRHRLHFLTGSVPKNLSSSLIHKFNLGCFPDISVGKESACNEGDPSLIPGLGRSAGEGIGYPLRYSWASLVAQLVKNQPAMRDTWVGSLVWEDPLQNGKATHSSTLAWRIPWTV